MSPFLSALTLIVKPDPALIAKAQARAISALGGQGIGPLDFTTLSEAEAAQAIFAHDNPALLRPVLAGALADLPVDYAILPAEGRRKRALLADMDSTMITVECIDELADYAGIKAEVARVTEAAMRGELDFAAALEARVRLLAGLETSVLETCFRERVRMTPGGATLVATMARAGARTVLVSGGFSFFTDRVRAALGFHDARANRLAIVEGRLTGTVIAPLVTAETKRDVLRALETDHGIAPADILAVGDGANDIPMLEAAGLGVAYHAKPKAEAAADVAIRHGTLEALLFLQGYFREEFAGAATD